MIHLNKFKPHLLAVEVPEGATNFRVSIYNLNYEFNGTHHWKFIGFSDKKREIIGPLSDCLKDERLAEKCCFKERDKFNYKSEESKVVWESDTSIKSIENRCIIESVDLSKNYLIIKTL